jgi:hypothetical protein
MSNNMQYEIERSALAQRQAAELSAAKPEEQEAVKQRHVREQSDLARRFDHHGDAASNEAPPKPKPSLAKPDDFTAQVRDERAAALDAEALTLEQRHAAEADALKARHEAEDAALAARREALDKEMEAVAAHAKMWARQSAELAAPVAESERMAMHTRHQAERAKLAHETGFDVLPPTTGDTIHPGFPRALPGHPWVRSRVTAG